MNGVLVKPLLTKFSFSLMAVVLMALAIAVSSAGATALCSEETEEGACGTAYEAETAYSASSSKSTFETSLGTITCESTLKGSTSEDPTEEGTPLKSTLTSLSFASCTLGKTACTVTAEKTPYAGSFSWTSGIDGTLSISSGGSGAPGVSVKCGFLISCTFTFEPTAVVSGGTKGTIAITKASRKESKGLCPETALWTATYTFTSPEEGKVYVADQNLPVLLCKENTSPCPGANVYLAGTLLEAKLESNAIFKVKLNEGGGDFETEVSCGTSVLKGQTAAFFSRPQYALTTGGGLSFTCLNPCTVTVKNLEYTLKFYDMGAAGDGQMYIESYVNGPPELQITCANFTCTYEAISVLGTVKGGQPAKLAIANASFGTKVAGDAKCRGILWEKGKYEFTKPEDGGSPKMWITRLPAA